ncbi:nitroreductase family protein [Acidiluteibacter ferrifornacis]|uniref:Nitroreductase n=1 Tax=Acidiluteibacter ferrifornacis TaxID=2692424 RepID=A0A6N9NHU9_9FLAO|nr:nitroreductase family protein [Acidiluteibacter ferrifornacis]NBG65409.1 nitroreductase [Acidiluteibacter ferrifornacis]
MNNLIEKRWSPRAFEDKAIEKEKLDEIFTAAGTAPSAFNAQPWRFIVGNKFQNKSVYEQIFSTLAPANKVWAENAPVLVLTVSEIVSSYNGKLNSTAEYDLGASTAYLSLQALELDVYVHQMSGFDTAMARDIFNIPEEMKPLSVIALGYLGDKNILPEALAEKESSKRVRKSLNEVVMIDGF